MSAPPRVRGTSSLQWSPGAAGPVLSGEDEEPGWQERALCAETDPEIFFPEKGGSTREAKRVCGSCEVRAECLGYAIDHDERFGIWGGLSERERRRLRRPPAGPDECCPSGHRYTLLANGKRECRTCKVARDREAYQRRAERDRRQERAA